jgi:tryptophan synthase alpha chain
MGVTGATETVVFDVAQLVARLRPYVNKPLAVGFGISTPDAAAAIGAIADGVVVGSGLIDRLVARPGNEVAAVREYCATLSAALRR